MTTRVWLLTTAAAAAVLGVAGCTSSASTPDHQTSGPTASSSVATETASPSSTASPTPSVVASCSAATTRLTYHRRAVVLAGQKIVVPPGGRHTPTVQLVHHKSYRATAPGLGTHSGLISSVNRHWHAHAAELGLSSGTGGGTDRIAQGKKTSKPRALVDYAKLTLYSGTFTSTCGGQQVTGRYQTYGGAIDIDMWCDTVKNPAALRICR